MTTHNAQPLSQQAAIWHAQLENPNCSAEQRQAFEAWHNENQEHALAYAQCQLTFEMSAYLSDDSDIFLERKAAQPAQHTKAVQWYQQPRQLMQIAAALVLAIGVGLSVEFGLDFSHFDHYSTGIGEQRLVRLEDGSSILLNTDTNLRVRYDDKLRLIELDNGEAYFTVAKNPEKPFEVHAGQSIARALGTQFSVSFLPEKKSIDKKSHNKKISVAVTEGLVEVESDTTLQSKDIIAQLSVGDAIHFDNKKLPQKPQISSADIKRIEAWQQRKIYFNANTLLEAINEYNRYSDMELLIVDESLKSEQISGLFNVGDIDAFIYSLENLLGINVVKNGQRIFLTKKS